MPKPEDLGRDAVLIESDWNLKVVTDVQIIECTSRINRIRLEFKGQKTDRKNQNRKRINRIRLEFKGTSNP